MLSWVYVPPVMVEPLPVLAGFLKIETKQVSISFIDGKVADTVK